MLGNQDWVGGEWAAMTALAMGCGIPTSLWIYQGVVDGLDDLTPRSSSASCTEARRGESRDAHMAEAAQRVSSAEEAQLFAEAFAELRREETGAKGVLPLRGWLGKHPGWGPWVGVLAVSKALWSEGSRVGLEVVNDLLRKRVDLSYEQWKAIDGKFRWAGHEKKLYESVRSVVGVEEFSNPAVLMVRAGDIQGPGIEQMKASLRPGQLTEQRLLRRQRRKVGTRRRPTGCWTVCSAPADEEWEKAAALRVETLNRRVELDMAQENVLSHREDRVRGLQVIQAAARDWSCGTSRVKH